MSDRKDPRLLKINRYDHSVSAGAKHKNLEVVEVIRKRNPKTGRPITRVRIRCTCGEELTCSPYYFMSRSTCGCKTWNEDDVRRTSRSQGGLTSKHKRTYSLYYNAYRRCNDRNSPNYWQYGERGIQLCGRWLNGEKGRTGFQCFLEDMGPCPGKYWTLDRIDNDEGYSPKNCRWAPKAVQAMNKRNSLHVMYDKGKVGLDALVKSRGLDEKRIKHLVLKRNLTAAQAIHYDDSVLGIDPGTKSYTVTWIKYGKVQASFHVPDAIDDLKDARQYDRYMAFVERLLRVTRPTLIIAEAFLERGGFATGLSARINQMHGILIGFCLNQGVSACIINPSQWKVMFKRIGDLKALYKFAKREYGLAPHNVDSMYMARFGYNGLTTDPNDRQWIGENLERCTRPFSVWEAPIRPSLNLRIDEYGHIKKRTPEIRLLSVYPEVKKRRGNKNGVSAHARRGRSNVRKDVRGEDEEAPERVRVRRRRRT